MASKSEQFWITNPTQVAPQQSDIDKIAQYKDKDGRAYAFWIPKDKATHYLDGFIADQLGEYGDRKDVIVMFVAQHKAEYMPCIHDTLELVPIKEGGELRCTVLNIMSASPPYRRARKSALMIASSPLKAQ